MDREDHPSQTSPTQAETQRPIRPAYLREDPWSSSSPPSDRSHWTRVRQLLTKCDGDTIGSWQEEINTQLIVSTLLAGLTGAFVIETQKSLSEDPIVTAAVLLSHIAMQLNASSVLPPSTLQPFSNPSPNAQVVNSLLYVSLGFSLSNVTLGLLCLQWLRELKTDNPGIPDRGYTYVHAVRHIGFQKWGAKAIISALPLLLLSSLTCFFAGLLCHISTTDWVVSIPVGIVLGATFAVLVLTTLLPAVVIAGCAAFHRGQTAESGGYPPIPPFYSLQSWIPLQLAVTILGSPILKKLTRFDVQLGELKRCPDWGRVASFWQRGCASDDPILLPFLHSSSNPSRFDDVALCLLDIPDYKQSPNANPVQQKMQTLHYFIERYSKELPPATLEDLNANIATHLVHYFNDGGDFSNLDSLIIEFAMDIEILSRSVDTQLFHALVQSYERKLPVIKASWNFFWVVFRSYTGVDPSLHSPTSLMLVVRAFDVIQKYGTQFSYSHITRLDQYWLFVHELAVVLTSFRRYTTTDHGKRVAATYLFHPAWNRLVLATRAQAAYTPDLVLESLDVLEHLKDTHAFHKYVPLSFDWTAPLRYPDSDPFQAHISIHMDVMGSEIGGFFPIVPALSPPDLVERDGEDTVGPADDGTISIVEETEHRIPISDSFSVPVSVHTEIGDAGGALRREEVREEEVEEESGSSASASPLPGSIDVGESEGKEVVDKCLVGPSLDGDPPGSRVLATDQSSSSVPASAHREAFDESDVEQWRGQGAPHAEEEKE